MGAETTGRAQDPDAGGTEARATAGFDGLNYIRNSVKVVVDMYDGTVRFYVMDPKDPVLAVYRLAFPGVFNDLSELSADLKKHLRYPEDLFTVQADQYRTFHMTDPQVFYNREDLWTAPMEKYAGQAQPMEPYYILTKLPGSDQLEYLLMTPFTPQNRDNMISWMAARSDFPEYGKMLFYELPKEKLIYGPNQVEAMIDQNTTISQQLTLWNQQGSRVIRGKQIVTPIENSFLYVVPLYLRAEGTNFPQLKRVIAVAGDKVVMEPTLDEALTALFGTQQPQAAPRSAKQTRRGREGNRRPVGRCPGENAVRGRPEGDAAGGLGQIRKSDGGAKTSVGQPGLVISASAPPGHQAGWDCFPPRLLAQPGTTVHVRKTEEAKLYAEVDLCIAAMVCAANRKPREPGKA